MTRFRRTPGVSPGRIWLYVHRGVAAAGHVEIDVRDDWGLRLGEIGPAGEVFSGIRWTDEARLSAATPEEVAEGLWGPVAGWFNNRTGKELRRLPRGFRKA